MTNPRTTHNRLLEELRIGLLKYLEQYGGEANGAEAVKVVARVHGGLDPSYTAAAMWTLVEDNMIKYDLYANLKLVAEPQPLPDLLSLDEIRELRELLGDFAQRRAQRSPYLELDDTQRAVSTVLQELDRLAARQSDNRDT
jgi:hypothetical protein